MQPNALLGKFTDCLSATVYSDQGFTGSKHDWRRLTGFDQLRDLHNWRLILYGRATRAREHGHKKCNADNEKCSPLLYIEKSREYKVMEDTICGCQQLANEICS